MKLLPSSLLSKLLTGQEIQAQSDIKRMDAA